MFDGRAGQEPGTPLVIASPGWAAGAAAGGRIVAVENGGSPALWAMPGPLLDELAAAGRVFASAPQAQIPPAAAIAHARVLDAPAEPIRLRPGAARDIRLEVHHAGTGSPWLQAGAGPGGVGVLTGWYGTDGQALRASQTAGLPRTLAPGETVDVDVALRASDLQGGPLAPARTGSRSPWPRSAGRSSTRARTARRCSRWSSAEAAPAPPRGAARMAAHAARPRPGDGEGA
jgi:hypothetical protein